MSRGDERRKNKGAETGRGDAHAHDQSSWRGSIIAQLPLRGAEGAEGAEKAEKSVNAGIAEEQRTQRSRATGGLRLRRTEQATRHTRSLWPPRPLRSLR